MSSNTSQHMGNNAMLHLDEENDGNFTELAAIVDIVPVESKVDVITTTKYKTGKKQKFPGVKEDTDLQFTIEFDGANMQHTKLDTLLGVMICIREEYPDGDTFDREGFISSIAPQTPVEGLFQKKFVFTPKGG